MARKNTGPRYFESKGGYYCTINGERHCLAKGPEDEADVKEAAERKYHELMLTAPGGLDGDRAACQDVLDRFLAYTKANRKPETYELWGKMCKAFSIDLGQVKVRDLKPHMVTAWLTRMQTPRPHKTRGEVKWGPGTVRAALTAIKAALNWAVSQGLISKNPLAGVKKPAVRSRGGDQLLSEEDHRRVLGVANARLRDYLIALNDTGARPGEVARVTAADFNEGIGAWVLAVHKTDRTGKKRVIYLTPRLVEMTMRLTALHPTGPLFRNNRGRPWTIAALSEAFVAIRKKLCLGPVTPYSYRHKFATEFLLKGGSMAYIAELQGNSVAMIEKHYGHLREHGTQLRQALIAFRTGQSQVS
jgi:integrase